MTAATGRRTRQDADSAIKPRTRLTSQSGKSLQRVFARLHLFACRPARFRCDWASARIVTARCAGFLL